MTSIREALTEAGFGWESGIIVYQPVLESAGSPGWAMDYQILPGHVIEHDHPILDRGFDNGFGGPQMPRFFARDRDAIYFPAQYDGSTWVERVLIEPSAYTDGETVVPTPYPGG